MVFIFPKTKHKLIVLNPFPIYPVISGGQGRVFHLYKHAANFCDIEIISFADKRYTHTISPGLRQILIPKSPNHCQLEQSIFRQAGFATCAIIPEAAALTPEYAYTVNKQSKTASAIILSHPYLYKQILNLESRLPIIYDAHNVEYELHQQILPASLHDLLAAVLQAEKSACEQSQFIMTCSKRDAHKLASLYHISEHKFIVVPNGSDTNNIPFISQEERISLKAAHKVLSPLAIYIGSCYPPNLQAAEQVIALAKQLPTVTFLLIGSICTAFSGKISDNVSLMGIVNEQKKYQLFSLADIALNPALFGSGTNLKMLEYMAAGIPIITSLLGARGLDGENGKHFIICQCGEMRNQVLNLLDNHALAARLTHHAYSLVNERFQWEQIAANFMHELSIRI